MTYAQTVAKMKHVSEVPDRREVPAPAPEMREAPAAPEEREAPAAMEERESPSAMEEREAPAAMEEGEHPSPSKERLLPPERGYPADQDEYGLPDMFSKLRLDVPHEMRPRLVGRKWRNVRGIQERFGVRITVPFDNNQVVVSGAKENVLDAAEYIDQNYIQRRVRRPREDGEQPRELMYNEQLDVPTAMRPRLVGRGARNLNTLRNRFNVGINVPRDTLVVRVFGQEENVKMAVQHLHKYYVERYEEEQARMAQGEEEDAEQQAEQEPAEDAEEEQLAEEEPAQEEADEESAQEAEEEL